jgi:hypothetical protein
MPVTPVPKFTLTGTFDEAFGGTVTLRPNVRAVVYEGALHPVHAETITAGEDGTFSVDLMANDDGLSVTGVQWHADVHIDGESVSAFWFDALDEGVSFNLMAIVPTAAMPAQSTPAVTANGVMTLIANAINDLYADAPANLNSFKELADALNDDANFAATVLTALAARLGLVQAAKNPDLLVTGAITVDGNDLMTSAAVVWPDGSPGTLTITSRDGNNAVLAYNITYGSPVTKTFTQPAITRNANGAATNVPAIVVS